MNKGIVLTEVVVVVSILLLIITSLIFANVTYLKTSSYILKSTEATFLAQEGIEAVKYIRSSGWENITGLSTGDKHYLSYATTTGWSATSTPEFVGVFSRSFSLEKGYRDSDQDIATSGTEDPNTRKLTVSVVWNGVTGTSTKEISTYITNFLE